MSPKNKELIINAGYVLAGENLELIERGRIVIQDGKIVDVDKGWGQGGMAVNDETLLAIPALVNAHIHLADSAILEHWLGRSLQDIVDPNGGLKIKALENMPKETIISSMADTLRYLESIGVLIAADFREQGPRGVKMGMQASREARYEGYLPLGRPRNKDEIFELDELAHGLGLPHPFYPDPETAKTAAFVMRVRDKPVVVHVAETPENVEGEFEAAIKSLKASALVHCIYLKEEMLYKLKLFEIGVIFTPRANLWFKLKEPPIGPAIEADIKFMLGTDNAGWVKPDVWREMEVALLIARRQLKEWDEDLPRKILAAVTVNAYTYLKLPWKPSIEVGSTTPILLLDAAAMGLNKAQNKYAAIVKRGGGEMIKSMVIKGIYKLIGI